MTIAKKEINVACNYLLRLIKAQTKLSIEQIQLFKTVFHETLLKRFINHWFPGKTDETNNKTIGHDLKMIFKFFSKKSSQRVHTVEVLIDVYKQNTGKILF